ncbi:GPP34 family phosphoprotein [Nonomuraea sp. 3-1Str]|uniref:GOLPH3/VPS74 family protein n=1 Tax=Nonomuraea sp. 3-1Str TaxID=2929801 RepID=UPI0028555B87|nr:GPP34 family phosphoprotein [Nonomuraea sp. 3-1Str]MDR8407903.1 GPP34 family phosphoprotein [Nonomuraea sp. 3-1Str]
MTVTIAEELLLLAYSEDEGKQLVGSAQLDPALSGALLAELAVNGRIELSDKTVTVKDPTPLGDEELDAALARIAAEGKERKPVWWVQRLMAGKPRPRLLTRLAETGVLTEQRGKVLGIFPTTRWPEADGSVEANVRERVASALGGADPDPRTAVLIALLHAAKIDRKAFPGASKERVKEIAEGAWTADAVAKTIAAINAAMMAAVTSAAIAASTSAATS